MKKNNATATWLEPEQFQALAADYRLTREPSADRTFSIPFTDLLNPEQSLAYFHGVSGIFETDSQTAAVSLFAKRYAFLVIAANLYAISHFNKGLNLELENGWIESSYQGKAWLPKARLHDWQVSEPLDMRREEWRDRLFERMFAGNLSRVWTAVSQTAKISKVVLWENTAIYVYWLYEKKFAEGADAEQKRRMEKDYHYLLHDAPPRLFGESRNPLKQFDSPKVYRNGYEKPLRVRKTCCFYYITSDEPADYCSTCPKRKC
ncbi:IucA/IucC family C-terminal-domain containing protein [uncultured Paenibacillus sp.]|uniref:IucA/IucC family C-terminal-domain containing protein n=1 Tax=uncultured Paenibacillus sp. TaxID=227322 RepID=UPI0015AAB339|nr:IucA/IucC family C-terminal-domain containing protein [uncultured Paenibacillus sp.]